MNTWGTNLGSYQKWYIGNDIRDILLENSGITAEVGTNIYPLIAPEPKEGFKNIGNFIIYGREKYSKDIVKQGIYDDECLVSLTIVSENYDTACKIASLADNALLGDHRNDKGELIRISLYDSTEIYTDNKYIETLVLKIK